MQFTTQLNRFSPQYKANAVFVGVYQGLELTKTAQLIDESCKKAITTLGDDFKAELGQILVLRPENWKTKRIVLVGLGKKEDYNAKSLLKVYASVADYCNRISLADAVDTMVTEPCADLSLMQRAQMAAKALDNANYRYTATFSKEHKPTLATLKKFVFLYDTKSQLAELTEGLDKGLAIASGLKFARELGNLPANYATPTYLGEQVLKFETEFKNVKVEVLKRKQIEALKMGSFLSVAAGSDEEPRFIVVKYFGKSGKRASNPKDPIVLVGKGVTFDAGGISLKPGLGMDEMKFDMCGAATVLGTMRAIMTMQLKLDVVALVPATENLPSGKATKPGDVVTSMSGQTIEVLNTDAEGRLILCDALTFAERFKPRAVIDVATLTGACVVALGHVHSGLYANDDDLADQLLEAAHLSQDTAWRMPLDDDYQEQLKSNFADMQNIGGMPGGSVTAACFLSRFTKSYKWAHLDIAGTAWKKGDAKGATGRPVSLLTQYLLNQVK